MSKQVLIITYFFPPHPEVGGIRLRGLAKYLPEFGWEPIILTSPLPEKPDPQFKVVQTDDLGDIITYLKQKFGLNENRLIEDQVGTLSRYYDKKINLFPKIIKLLKRLVKEIIAYPDEYKQWRSIALAKTHELLRNEKFDALISSSYPFTCHLIAKGIKVRYSIPWIADLRDLWTRNHYYPYSPIRKLFERGLELKTLSFADALVTVSDPLAQKLRTLHKGKPVYVITNGFDPDEVKEKPLTKEFTITYTGYLYKGKRNPGSLFKAIAELINERMIERQKIKIRFYGISGDHWLENEIQKYHLEDVVSMNPKIQRDIALDKQRESQILLLLNYDHPEEAGVYTGKLFEYLAAKRPILAIGGPRGVVTELLEETRAGVHPLNYEELKKVLLEFYNEYKTCGYVPYKGNEEKISKYSHREMAKRFAELLEIITKMGNS